MIISIKPFGRLGNRLFLFSHLIAFAERYNVRVLSPALSEYRNDFPFFADPSCAYEPGTNAYEPHRISVRALYFKAVLGIVPTVRFWDDHDMVFDGEDSNDPRVKRMIESPRVFFEGWRFRSHETILKIMPRIREVFVPREDVRRSVDKRSTSARERGDIVVGVHLRWEDYRGTPLFFPLPSFLDRMKEIAELLQPAKTSFLIVSPEKLDQADFPAECIICSGGGAVHDLYTLAACDYIMGPPSTFSGWASFYGGKPLFAMREDSRFDDLSTAETIRW